MDVVHLLEPVGVLQIEVQRKRLDVARCLAACLKKALEGVSPRGVQLPLTPRAKHHPRRHVPFPERHRLSEYQMVDAKLSGLDRHGEAEWSGTDDEKRYIQDGPTARATALVRTCIASSLLESRVRAVR